MISDRAFLTVNAGNFTLDWPMVVQVDPATRPPEVFRGAGNLVDGAGWIAFTTNRKKPQVKAQTTYYVPGTKAGSHDFKFGFEYLYDSYRYGHNGRSGPIRYSYPCGSPTACAPDRIRFIDTGDPNTYGTDWTVVDCNATSDHQAVLQSSQVGLYDVYMRILGKPGGHFLACGQTLTDFASGETLCLLGTIDLTRSSGQSKFQLAPSAMFDASLEDLIWTVDTNTNFRIVQFRVYSRP